MPAASKISITQNPARKFYNVLRSDLRPYDIVHVIDGSSGVGKLGHIYARGAGQVSLLLLFTLSGQTRCIHKLLLSVLHCG